MFNLRGAIATAILASAAANAWSAPQVTTYTDICEASAAAALDAQRFVVADDEHNVLSIYRVGIPKRGTTVDLVAHLDDSASACGLNNEFVRHYP